jgi:hypothetical protein
MFPEFQVLHWTPVSHWAFVPGTVLIEVLIVYSMTFALGNLSRWSLAGFVGLASQRKDIVFRFIIEYSSFMDFGP